MTQSIFSLRPALLACVLAAVPVTWAGAAEPARLVFQSGKSIPINALALQGDQLIVQTATDAFNAGVAFPVATVDHVYGEKPAAVNQGIALLLMDNAKEAIKLLEPVVAQHRITAKIPGNLWLEAARALLVARAVNGNSKDCTDLGKEISDATPAQGIDPYVTLGRALLMPVSTDIAARDAALRDLTTENLPADLCAYASFFRGKLFVQDKKPAEALEAYLTVSCLFPSGGLVLNSAAEFNASEFLTTKGQREEAIAVLRSAARNAPGTIIAEEANKRLESLK